MSAKQELVIANMSAAIHRDGAGISYLIQTPTGVLYQVFGDVASDIAFIKSTDGGRNWSFPVVVFAGTATSLTVWYDRWSDISAGLIHCAYQESATDDTFYRTINTESADALSTQTTILAGTSTLAGGCLSITRARGGNVYCATMIDAGTEGGFLRLPNANVPNGAWDAARATVFEGATQDQVQLVPGFAADTQDIMAIFMDASADELTRKVYDDSANSWAETSIATGIVDLVATTAFRNFAVAVDLANSQVVLASWTQADLANADLRCWTITESAITEVTNVVLNSTDDQGLCAVAVDVNLTDHWVVFYLGKSDGSETWTTLLNMYSKETFDGGTTWSAERAETEKLGQRKTLWTTPRFVGAPIPVVEQAGTGTATIGYAIVLPTRSPHATFQLGM